MTDVGLYLIAFGTTMLVGMLLLGTRRLHGRFSMDSMVGVQKLHIHPTPRIGGIAIMMGLVGSLLWAPPQVAAILRPMLLAGSLAFVFGLAEDVTKQVSVTARLLATMCSGALACWLTGVAMQDTGFPPLDFLLGFTPAAILFTAFAVGGVANAINIIDGFNGLASGAVAIMVGAIGLIALNVGDVALASTCFLVAMCALGFVAVNWPLGKIFLGDGGAYLLGFMLAWAAVLLPMRSPHINAWATILVCAYPVLEVGFSVQRRRRRHGHHPGQPDKAHLHHLLHRRVVRKLFPSMSPTLQNGLTSPVCWLIAAVPAGIAVAFAQDTQLLVLALAVYVFFYAAIYARLTQFRWCLSARTLRPVRAPTIAKLR
jgi:UDP-N-acetylmuramyl pentapeptide phosphotransferase/UDP-N-acetylglucosamine-1-phosphate transferase